MSLTSFTARSEVIKRLKPFRPPPPRTLKVPVKVERKSIRPSLIGTGFDYLIRIELSRRAPHASCKRWVAESGGMLNPSTIVMLHDPIRKFAASHPEFNLKSLIFGVASNPSGKLNRNGLAVTFDVRKSVFSATISVPNGEWCFDLASEELFFFQRTANVLDQARKAVECYCKIESPTASQHLDLAIHALRLAKLDVIYRAGILDATFETADTDDADELVRLLAVVPFAELIDSTVMMLNPTFGEASTIVGGADADLIVRTTLVDFKTTKEAITDPSYLDQLLGYFLLARYARRKDVTFPTIERVALYFSRCAHLWTHDVSLWTACAGFEELESWFFDHAKEVFQQDPIRVSSLPGKPAPVQSTKSTKK